MTSRSHKKHGKTKRPSGGRFHFNEVAIIGAPCSTIEDFSEKLAAEFSPAISTSYVDASHKEHANQSAHMLSLEDRQSSHVLNNHSQPEYSMRKLLSSADIALVNGNHFQAQNQIVIINDQKQESLNRKLDRLTNPVMFILDGVEEPYDFLKDLILDKPIFKIDQIDQISNQLLNDFELIRPDILGLVLAGGKSLRMGQDKGAIKYHGKPQREYAADILATRIENVYLSVRQDNGEIESNYDFIQDSFLDLGPFGGILSAFREHPDNAILAVATDIPKLSSGMIEKLLEMRNPSKVATCFYNPETNFPEPLITIWEPRAYSRMLEFLGNGLSCPRKVLINSEVEVVDAPEYYEDLVNINTPTELASMFPEING